MWTCVWTSLASDSYLCMLCLGILIMRKMMELDREVSASLNTSDPTKTKKIVILISHHSCGQIRRRKRIVDFVLANRSYCDLAVFERDNVRH
ncbi:hypothetical protein glysoja_026967 [Glycine soja]|uniref:Uncharacterized protein n=1 Tax=Glycine soja TaxID=3848 RepID=A0A0B2QBS4_GLYSO|nr:hypothetical protein glysoja_026967 [Glycine soja]